MLVQLSSLQVLKEETRALHTISRVHAPGDSTNVM